MDEKKLDCCVVRDLLPAYIEELTEMETAAQVAVHLERCPECRRVESDMRAQAPVEKAPKSGLNFLKRVKRTRLLAAVLAAVLALWSMWWLYDQEFHYPNTEAGRLAAVSDYIPSPPDSSMQHVRQGDSLRVIAWQERDGRLLLFYGADNQDNVHGIVHLVRGINGKYRLVNASFDPFPYTAGIYSGHVWLKGTDERLFALAGDSCREIYGVQVDYSVMEEGALQSYPLSKTYPITEPNFLWLYDQEELMRELGLEGKSLIQIHVDEIHLLDKDGNDVTEQYRDPSVTQSWGGGKSTAEMGLLYVYMGIAAALGMAFVRYFLRKD